MRHELYIEIPTIWQARAQDYNFRARTTDPWTPWAPEASSKEDALDLLITELGGADVYYKNAYDVEYRWRLDTDWQDGGME